MCNRELSINLIHQMQTLREGDPWAEAPQYPVLPVMWVWDQDVLTAPVVLSHAEPRATDRQFWVQIDSSYQIVPYTFLDTIVTQSGRIENRLSAEQC